MLGLGRWFVLVLAFVVVALVGMVSLACSNEDALERSDLDTLRAEIVAENAEVTNQLNRIEATLATLLERVTPVEPTGVVIPEYDESLTTEEAVQVMQTCITDRIFGSDAPAVLLGLMDPSELLGGFAATDDIPGIEQGAIVRYMGTVFGCWR